MALSDEPPLRDLPDKAMRQSLQHPEHLRTFLLQAVPQLAAGFDCTRARLLDREFPLDDWRHREADLPFEIPYRLGDQDVWALVVLLLEHQSDTDPLMPLRLLYFAVIYWDKQWHDWEQLPKPRPPLRLRPVLPIVLYTAPRVWGSNRTLVDLLGEPEAFHSFAPAWEPLFWNLSDQSPEALLQSGLEWLQTLAVVRAQDAEPAVFQEVFVEALRQLQALHGRDPVRWYDLMRIVLTWALWRRPLAERQTLLAAAQASDADVVRQREMQEMNNKLGPTLAEVAWAKGEAQGEAQGKTKEAFNFLMRLGRKRFGEPDEATRSALQGTTDVERLERLGERLFEVVSWQELLQTP